LEGFSLKSPTMPISEGLWAVTTYFNPMRYRRRLSNFRLFRKHLNIPLVAVELAYGKEFELPAVSVSQFDNGSRGPSAMNSLRLYSKTPFCGRE
jgi:hypothetical protein